MSSSSQQMPGLDLPCLAFHDLDRSTVLINMQDHKRIVGDETIPRDKVINPTAPGLLLVRDPGSMTTFLLNPTNKDKVDLPPLRQVDVNDVVLIDSHCLLSDEPVGPQSLVLLVEASENTFIWYCHPGGDRWNKYEYDIGSQVLPYPDDEEDQIDKMVICPIAACQGKFYFYACATELQVLDLSSHEPVLSAITIDDTVDADGSYGFEEENALIFLVESGGELYMVRLLYVSTPYEGGVDDIPRIRTASVHRMDFARQRWRNVHDLGGRAFLLSRYYFGASRLGGEYGLPPDRVYFLCAKTNNLQVFDVQERTYQLHKLDEAPVVDKAFWLLPSTPYRALAVFSPQDRSHGIASGALVVAVGKGQLRQRPPSWAQQPRPYHDERISDVQPSLGVWRGEPYRRRNAGSADRDASRSD